MPQWPPQLLIDGFGSLGYTGQFSVVSLYPGRVLTIDQYLREDTRR